MTKIGAIRQLKKKKTNTGNANHGEGMAIKKAYRQSIQVGKRSFLCSRVRESSKETMYLAYVDTHEYMRHRAVHDTDYRSRNPTLSYGERNSSVTRSNWYSSQARIYASRSPIRIGVGQVNSLVPCMNRVSRDDPDCKFWSRFIYNVATVCVKRGAQKKFPNIPK